MGLSESEIDSRVREAARLMGVHDTWLQRSPFDLSGGQKRRAALAGVIAMRPQILILDEPAAGLDPRGRDKILGFIADYQEKSKITVALVSHSMEDIVKYADRVLVLNKGSVFAHEETDRVFAKADTLTEIGLGLPQIARLAGRLREHGVDLGDDVYTVERATERILELIEEQGAKVMKSKRKAQ
jgi:energy-coupling factor transport system ATP-binding protein